MIRETGSRNGDLNRYICFSIYDPTAPFTRRGLIVIVRIRYTNHFMLHFINICFHCGNIQRPNDIRTNQSNRRWKVLQILARRKKTTVESQMFN